MYKSKRFVAFVTSVALFILFVFLTDYPPLEIATSISIISGIYITNQSLRSSKHNEENGKQPN